MTENDSKTLASSRFTGNRSIERKPPTLPITEKPLTRHKYLKNQLPVTYKLQTTDLSNIAENHRTVTTNRQTTNMFHINGIPVPMTCHKTDRTTDLLHITEIP